MAVLVGYLAQMIQEGLVHWWDDRNLNTADAILLLHTRHFFASSYCTTIEVPRAIHRRDTEGVQVVPIILDDSDFRGQPYMTRQALPTDAKPILSTTHWPDPSAVWRQVADRLRVLVAT